jgi:hypothetical protein
MFFYFCLGFCFIKASLLNNEEFSNNFLNLGGFNLFLFSLPPVYQFLLKEEKLIKVYVVLGLANKEDYLKTNFLRKEEREITLLDFKKINFLKDRESKDQLFVVALSEKDKYNNQEVLLITNLDKEFKNKFFCYDLQIKSNMKNMDDDFIFNDELFSDFINLIEMNTFYDEKLPKILKNFKIFISNIFSGEHSVSFKNNFECSVDSSGLKIFQDYLKKEIKDKNEVIIENEYMVEYFYGTEVKNEDEYK